MKFAIILVATIGLVAAIVPDLFSNYDGDDPMYSKNCMVKQKFLLEIVYRIDDPLIFEEWIKLGQTFTLNKDDYTHYDQYMENFYEAFKNGAILAKGEFFGALVETHLEQANGLYNFFHYAKNWEVFQRNVAWARMHCNEGMFVYALTMAVHFMDIDCPVGLPAIHEIFPQNFFNRKFINAVKKFDYDVWSKYTQDEKQYHDTLYKSYIKNKDNHNYFFTRDWKTWQWWKLMGLNEQWYTDDPYKHINDDNKYYAYINEDLKLFWMPVDFTRDIEFFNKESALSYFTESVALNSYWYNFNLKSTFFMQDGFVEDWYMNWLFHIRQLLARYYMERLSHGYGEIPELSFFDSIEYGYNPQLVYYNGVGYSYRKNYYEIDYYSMIVNFSERLNEIIAKGVYVTYDNQTIDFSEPESVKYIDSIKLYSEDTFDEDFFKYFYLYSHMQLGNVESSDLKVLPNVLLNYETMARDPLFYIFYKKIASIHEKFLYNIKPYTREELLIPGITIKNVQVSELVTFFDLEDYDVTNLMKDKTTFIDRQLVWNKTLFARQIHLNHKPFHVNYTIESDKYQKVVVRTFMGPKYNEFGHVLSLTENREYFMQLSEEYMELQAGVNELQEYYWPSGGRITYSETYQKVMGSIQGKHRLGFDVGARRCDFPTNLVLPRGWKNGMPMQFFFYVTPHSFIHEYNPCDMGYTEGRIDDNPFRYPIDREIDANEFFVPNMYLKTVKIYHEDNLQQYYGNKNEHFYKNMKSIDMSY